MSLRTVRFARIILSRTTLVAGLTTVTLIALCSTAHAQQGQRNGPPVSGVIVENPDSDPVPVTGVVNVGNLPAVQDVRVTNPVAPVAKQRVQLYDVTLLAPGDNGFGVFGFGKSIYTVPASKRLIVETVSAFASDIKGVNYDVGVIGSGVAQLSFLLTTKGVFAAGSIPEKGRDAVTASATLIVNSGDDLSYQFIRDVSASTESAGVSLTVVGFLEDVP